MRKIVIAGIVLAALPAIAQTAQMSTKTPFTAVEKLTPENVVRHVSGRELGDTMKKGMTPGAFYSQIMLSKHDGYQIINTIRDKDGQAEIHADWNDNLFVQEGEASFVTGGSAVDAKTTAPGEQRGTAIKGGNTMTMRAGDYFFVPAGTPHQMKVAAGQRIRFIAFKTHK
jgi:mannose-6-phosphate isomerase-like protein (cupin superfamily)